MIHCSPKLSTPTTPPNELPKVQGRASSRAHVRRRAVTCQANWWPFQGQSMADHSLSLEQRINITNKEYENYKNSFPEVEDITAEELKKLLESDPSKIVLIDVRTPEERQVSQIPGTTLTPAELDGQKSALKDVTAVCYCTAGMRSGKYAAKLKEDGVNVKNLRGSIISWTQHGYPLVKGDGSKEPTIRVHTFGAHWGNQMGDGYELQYFNPAKGALEISKTMLPKWLGGTG